jgi:hypothetical protein
MARPKTTPKRTGVKRSQKTPPANISDRLLSFNRKLLPATFVLAFALIGGIATLYMTRADSAQGSIKSAVGSNMCLDNKANIKESGNKIQLYSCNTTNAQKWTIKDNGSIVNANGYCLDVKGASKQPKAIVQLYSCNGTVAQKWHVKSNGSIVNPNSALCLDVKYGENKNGTQIWMYTCNGTAAQRWTTPKTVPAPTPIPVPTPPTPTPTPTPVPPVPTPTTPKPVGVGGTWKLAFQDEFTGNAVDSKKWTRNWLAGANDVTKPINNAEVSCYDPANATVADGELKLKAVKSSCKASDGKTYAYRSGMIQSNGKFNYTYGVAEARLWLPAGEGAWPAFWSTGQNWPTDGEIDTVEAYGDNVAEYHYHYGGAGCGVSCGPGGGVTIPGATSGWHTYATKWEPGKITWYYDGKAVWQWTTSVTNKPLYLVANFGLLGKDWGTGKVNNPPLPAAFRVDYIRVWQ